VSAFIDDQWVTISADTSQSAGQHFNNSNQYVMDIMDYAVDPIDNTIAYAASWEEGLLKVDAANKRLIPANGTATTGPDSDGVTTAYLRTAVGGVAYSDDGILWCTNGYTKRALHALDREGNFYDYNFGSVISDNEKVADLLISNDGYIWANVINKGLLVFNTNGTLDVLSDDNFKLLTDVEGNGKLATNDVLCMEEDLDGEVWVGTGSGLSIFYNPASIFAEGNFDSEQILIQQDGNTQILLETEAINCIEIDGSNRKWIGTKNSGAYLFSDDGLREIYHFTEENSPLPSNTVYDIAINHSNGEVFFATENGVVGFFSTATNFDNEMSNVRVFPNPVRPEYDGNITIDGLAYNTRVKITDIQGNILFETESEGGRAVWNGLLSDGTRPATGVYLVYVSTETGTADEVRKLTFIR
jgi:ligand-binding sensor domain-containing protein